MQKFVLCFNIFDSLSVITPPDLFIMAPHSSTGSYRFTILRHHCSTEAQKHFLSCSVIPHWNSLPSDVVDASSLGLFKSTLTCALLFNPSSSCLP